jgi:hypothetical protein
MIGGYVGSYDGDPEMPKAMKVTLAKEASALTTASVVLDKPIAGFVFGITAVNDPTSGPKGPVYNIALQCPLGADLTGTDWDSISTTTVTYTPTTSDVPLLGYGTVYFDTLGTDDAYVTVYLWYK